MKILKPGDVIGLDFDGVIADTELAKLRFARGKIGFPVLRSQLKRSTFRELFGDPKGVELYDMMLASLYKTRAMTESVNLIPSAREGISELRALGLKCIIVTARHGPIHDASSPLYWANEFIKAHDLSSEIQDILSASGYPKSKIIRGRGVKAFVDDDYIELQQMTDLEIVLFLYTSATNHTLMPTEHNGATRVNNWLELVAKIKALM